MSLLPASGLEDHPDGTGNINSILNGNWDIIESWGDIAYGLTASQTTTALSASAPVFILDMVGSSILYADGTVATITAFVDSQHVTVTPSQTVATQAFKVYRTDQSPYTFLGRALCKVVRFQSSDDAKLLVWDNTLTKFKLISRPGFGISAGNILFGGGTGNDATSSADLNFDNTAKVLAVNGGATFAGTFYGAPSAVAASTSTTSIDGKLACVYNVTLSANTTIDMTNVKAGATYILVLRQDGTGSRTVAWAAKFKFPNGGTQAVYSAASAITVFYAQAVTTSEINVFAAKDFFEKTGGTITGATTFGSTAQFNGAVTVSANLTVNSGGVLSVADVTQTGKTNGVKIYRALLSQAGTAAPTATVLENTLGGTPTFSYNSVGSYTLTLTGAFAQTKTFFGGANFTNADGPFSTLGMIWGTVNTISLFSVTNSGGAGAAIDAFDNIPIEIRVYP